MEKRFIFKRICSLIITAALLTVFITGCAMNVPKPSVKKGEFNFSVTYEVNGKTEIASGVLVCEFKKAMSTIDGWWREWDAHLEDNNVSMDDIKDDMIVLNTDDGDIYLCFEIDPMYFMSDPFYEPDDESADAPSPYVYICYNGDIAEEKGYYGTDPEALFAEYGVRIISYEYDKPIENTYE